MKPLRVLHIYQAYFPESQGGLEESIRQLCLATQPLGVRNTVFALADSPEPARMQLPEGELVRARSLVKIASSNIGGWDALRRCRQAADDCDVIQVHFPWPFADVMLPFIRRNQPLVVTYVSDIVRQRSLEKLYAPLRSYLLGQANRVVASSPNYVRTSPVLARYAAKLACIPHCLGPIPVASAELVRQWRERLGQDFFLFIGVLRYYKGLHFLLDAAARVQHPIVLLGDGPEGARLRADAQRLGLKHVHFLGALPDADKYALLSLCRGVVFPSHLRSEAFGMTLLEGAQAGKPLVSCDIGTGTSWINLHDETGLVVPPADPVSLAVALNTLAQDDALCHRFGEAARKRWAEHFSPSVTGSAYRALYDDVLTTQG